MNRLLKIFKYVAFLNIPFMVASLYYVYEPFFRDVTKEELLNNYSMSLVLIGFGLSFTSLRDMSKIDKMGRFIIERPVFFKSVCMFLTVISIIPLIVGSWLLFSNTQFNDLGIGLLSFGIGFLALIKSFVEQAKGLTKHYN